MSSSCTWLPPLIPFSGILADLDAYIEQLYEQFKRDHVYSYATFNGSRVVIRAFPKEDEKEQTFFHLTTNGQDNANRNYNFGRCERIAWPKPIIENAHQLKVWESSRKTKKGLRKRVCIATPSFDYMVVLEPRANGVFVLVTAFCIDYQKDRDAKKAEYMRSI